MRKLLTTLAVLILLLVVADFGLRWYAGRQIGDAIAKELKLSQSPDVSIAGFPFVLQAINGEYNTITIDLPAVPLGKVEGVSATADLIGVKIPLADALRADTSALTASSTLIRLSFPIPALAAASGLPNLEISGTADGGLRAQATLTVLGQTFPVAATLTADVQDSTLQLRSGSVDGVGVTLPAQVTQAIGSMVSLDVPLTSLPFTITQASVTVTGGNVVVFGSTAAVRLADL